MFSPENFYRVLVENHSHLDHILFYVPNYHGAKDLSHFGLQGQSQAYIDRFKKGAISIYECANLTHVWLYDQEVVYSDAVNIYRGRLIDLAELEHEKAMSQLEWPKILACTHRCLSAPIWCHSEINSEEIKLLERNFFVGCYYWYHAFVARDWFRHWQYDCTLRVQDKSSRPSRFLLYCRDTSGRREYRKKMLHDLNAQKQHIRYQWEGENTATSKHSAIIDTQDASVSAIQLVAETVFESSTVHLTEKIFKPMVMSQPFILWAAPGSLKVLRKYGFQTFDHVWSESYDQECDHAKRQQMLADLVSRLCDLSDSEFTRIYQKCLPVIEHNRKRFFSYEFMEFCWQELCSNFDQALAISQDLVSRHAGGQFCQVVASDPDLANISAIRLMAKKYVHKMPSDLRDRVLKQYPCFSA